MGITKKRVKFLFIFPVLWGLLMFFANTRFVSADHLTPERVVEEKYTIILSVVPEGEMVKLRFIFRDTYTGKNFTIPVTFRVTVRKEGDAAPILVSEVKKAEDGIGELSYQFPSLGLYEISLAFEKGDELGKIYKGDSWPVWAPGSTPKDSSERYPIGLSELASFILLFLAILAVLASVWWKRKTGKDLEINIFNRKK